MKEHYDLAVSAFYGLEGNLIPWNGIPVLPGMGQTHGNETILPHARTFFGGDLRGGMVVTLMDVWVLDPTVWSRMDAASWVPVDHEPCPGPVAGFFQNSGAVPIAMSKFGQKMLRDEGLDPLYCPHAVDCSVYKPHDKTEARGAVGLPVDPFIVGMVAANKGNPSRKCFAEAFQAFKALHDLHPESRLYCHCEATGMFGGVNLPELIRAVGLDPDAVIFPDQYRAVHFPHTPETMAKVFSSFDVLLSPSAGEGFGVPVVEAQSCGVPVIVSDFSAQPELVGSGWKVEGVRHYTPIGSWQFSPSVQDILDALKKAHRMTEREREERSAAAREFAEGYDLPRVLDGFMLPALAECEGRFAARRPQTLKAA